MLPRRFVTPLLAYWLSSHFRTLLSFVVCTTSNSKGLSDPMTVHGSIVNKQREKRQRLVICILLATVRYYYVPRSTEAYVETLTDAWMSYLLVCTVRNKSRGQMADVSDRYHCWPMFCNGLQIRWGQGWSACCTNRIVSRLTSYPPWYWLDKHHTF